MSSITAPQPVLPAALLAASAAEQTLPARKDLRDPIPAPTLPHALAHLLSGGRRRQAGRHIAGRSGRR